MNLSRLRKLRKELDKTQAEIAEILGISCWKYGLYENGDRPMEIEHVIMLCKYYNVSANYILGLPEGLPYPDR